MASHSRKDEDSQLDSLEMLDPSFDDTGNFGPVDTVPRVHADFDGEPMVYGLETNKVDYEAKANRDKTIRMMLGGLVGAAAIVGFLMVAKPFAKPDTGPRTEPVAMREEADEAKEEAPEEPEATAEEPAAEEQEEPEQTVDEAPEAYVLSDQPTPDDIVQQAHNLHFGDGDVSVLAGDVNAEIVGGRVQVTNILTDLNGVEPQALAGNAALRCAAMASAIGDRQVRSSGDAEAQDFIDVVWVVRNNDGDSFLAVMFPRGGAPTSGDGLAVLQQAPRYRLSDSLYWALGQAVQQEMGETPIDVNNKYIWSTA
ncbi:MAG: hypothetical protein IJ781_10355, partial [Atopobiaceae bacterium]|nr:hypothetical protein [Atopobiaceae bacterium]